jgi:hypothetical protein
MGKIGIEEAGSGDLSGSVVGPKWRVDSQSGGLTHSLDRAQCGQFWAWMWLALRRCWCLSACRPGSDRYYFGSWIFPRKLQLPTSNLIRISRCATSNPYISPNRRTHCLQCLFEAAVAAADSAPALDREEVHQSLSRVVLSHTSQVVATTSSRQDRPLKY